jgi:hypothetical protein
MEWGVSGTIASCGHLHCISCVQKLVASDQKCPTCRAELRGNWRVITQAECNLPDVAGPGCNGPRDFPIPLAPEVSVVDFGSKFAAVVSQINVILRSDPTAKILVPNPSSLDISMSHFCHVGLAHAFCSVMCSGTISSARPLQRSSTSRYHLLHWTVILRSYGAKCRSFSSRFLPAPLGCSSPECCSAGAFLRFQNCMWCICLPCLLQPGAQG